MAVYFRLKNLEPTQGLAAWYEVEILDSRGIFATLRFDHEYLDAEEPQHDTFRLKVEMTCNRMWKTQISQPMMLAQAVLYLEEAVVREDADVIETIFGSRRWALYEWVNPPAWLRP